MAFDPEDMSVFVYRGIRRSGGTWSFDYSLVGSYEIEFTETLTYPNCPDPGSPEDAAQARLARLLFLAVGLSYYKASAPPTVHLIGGWTRAEQDFLTQLIRHGLGEFAYVNDLPRALSPRLQADRTLPDFAPVAVQLDARHVLTPVGGGKDSCVTIDAVRRLSLHQTLFSVNRFAPIMAVADVSGYPLISAERKLSANLFELNASGARNGHVPVTAINSLAALMAALAVGAGSVLMSNERSASEENTIWNGQQINHQWSKSLAFESLLRGAVGSAVAGLDYFSVLREYSEYRIAQRFAALSQYHPVFASCGRAFRRDAHGMRWCGQCPKCRFVAVILAPFLGPEQLWAIFGKSLFVGSLDPFLLLAGIGGDKPMECVGEIAETRLAISVAANSPKWRDDEFLRALADSIPAEALPTEEQIAYLLSPTPPTFAPKRFQRLLDDDIHA